MKPRGVSQGVTIWFVWAIVFSLNGDDVRTQQIPRPPFDANEQPLSDTQRSSGEFFKTFLDFPPLSAQM